MNIGFMEAMKLEQFDCVIFHDVDLLPQNDRNMYTCPDKSVRHMSAYIDKFNYKYVMLFIVFLSPCLRPQIKLLRALIAPWLWAKQNYYHEGAIIIAWEHFPLIMIWWKS